MPLTFCPAMPTPPCVSVPSPLHRISLVSALVALAAMLGFAVPVARADAPPANITPPAWTDGTNSPDGCEDTEPCVYQIAHATRGTWADESSLTFRFELLV